MAQTLKRKFPALILCAALLLGLCGCQKQKAAPAFPFDSKGVAYLLYHININRTPEAEKVALEIQDAHL